MATYSVDETLDSIRLRADLLDSDTRFTDENLLLLLNEEQGSWLVPVVAEMMAEFFVTVQDTLLVANVRHFNVPGGAVGGRVRLVQLLDGSKHPRFNCRQVDAMDDVRWWAEPWLGNLGEFFFRGDQLVLLGPLQAGWYLRIAFERRPSQCVLLASCAQVSSITGSGPYTVTVNAFPDGMTSGVEVDLVRGASPWTTFDTLALPTPSTNTLSFSTLPTDSAGVALGVGDCICFEGQAPFHQVPQEAIPALREWLGLQALAIKGGAEAIGESSQLLAQTDKRMRKVLAPRDVGNRKPVGNGLAYPVAGWPGFWGW